MKDILGGIMGLVVGDAVGVPFEFKDRDELKRYPVMDMEGYGTYNQPPGTWSDDTSMNLATLDSLINGIDYDDLMKKFEEWITEGKYTANGRAFDVGNTTRLAISNYLNNTPAIKCGGGSERDNGNGSLMRILPIAFYLHHLSKIEKNINIIYYVSGLTHRHLRSKIACVIYCNIVNEILNYPNKPLNELINEGIDKTLDYYSDKKDNFTELKHYKRLFDKSIFKAKKEEIFSTGYVVHTLEAAIWCLINTENYRGCILQAVNLGEDTDTIAAIAGGISGVYYGYNDIPKNWLNKIAKRKQIELLCKTFYNSLIKRNITNIISFKSYFENANENSFIENVENTESNELVIGTTQYEKEMFDFDRKMYEYNIIDKNYMSNMHKISEKYENIGQVIEDGTINELITILTFFLKQEKVGHETWADAIESKIFYDIICRLEKLSNELEIKKVVL